MRPENPPPRIRTSVLIAGMFGLVCIILPLLFFIVPGFFFGAGPLFRLLHSEGDTYDRYAGGGWFEGSGPSMSPDGRLIVYSSPRSGRGDIYLVKNDGTGTKRLTTANEYEAEPSFSPDGKRVVYVRQIHDVLNSYKSQIWIMNADGTGQRQLTRGREEYFDPAFTSDGANVICVMPGALCLVEISSGKIVEIGNGNLTPISTYGDNVYYTEPEEDADSHIMVVNQDGTGRKSLGTGNSPSISPDGKLIVFLDEPDNQPLWVMNSDGSNRRNIPTPAGFYIDHPTFTPDGKRILFLAVTDRGVGDVMMMGLDGSGLKKVTSTK